MADIQPKNTDTIRVNAIAEKTTSNNIAAKNNFVPYSATINLGTSTAAYHWLEGFFKELTSNGQDITIGTDSAHNIIVKMNANTYWTFTQSTGNLDGNSSNGGDLTFNKTGSGICHQGTATFTCAGTTQGTATSITSVVTVITSCSAGVTDGAILPTITATTLFKPRWIANESGASAKIYPATGAQIDDVAANGAYTLADNTHKVFMPITTTRWLSF